jgi:uncharacterized protein
VVSAQAAASMPRHEGGLTTRGPTAKSFQRAYRLRTTVDVPRETVAEAVVKAVHKGRRHVRLPKRSIPFAMMVEAPRRVTEVLLTGVPHQAK